MVSKKQNKTSKKQNKLSQAKQTTLDIIDYAKLVIVAIIMIVFIWQLASIMIGQLPATIGATIIGIVMIFIYATSKKVRESINDWIKRKR